MTFSNTLSTDTGKVRLYVGDDTSGTGVLPDGSNFTDEQIAIFMADNGSNIAATVAAICDNLAARWAIVPDSITAGGLTVSRSERVAHWQALADKYAKLSKGGLRTVAIDRRDAFSVSQERGGDELIRETDNTYTDPL